MSSEEAKERMFRLFADILAYPQPELAEALRECEALLSVGHGEAAALLRQFTISVEQTPLQRQQEVYTGTFDLDPTCYPYVGYHLFGESYIRSAFLVALKERYQARGFVVDEELPDHLAVLLRFLGTNDDQKLAEELIQEALLPALDRMLGEGRTGAQPRREDGGSQQSYQQVLQALRLVLKREYPAMSLQPSGEATVAVGEPLKLGSSGWPLGEDGPCGSCPVPAMTGDGSW